MKKSFFGVLMALFCALSVAQSSVTTAPVFNQGAAGAVTRSLQAKAKDFVSVKDFGAVADDDEDDTSAIVAAIAAKDAVYFPAGTYLVSSTITVSRDGVSLYGDGVATKIKRTNGGYGDTIRVSKATPETARLSRFAMRGMWIEAAVDMTAGAHLHIVDAIQVDLSDLHFWNGFVSMKFDGVQNAIVRNTKIDAGAYYTAGIRAGSRFVEIMDANNPEGETGELFFSDFNWTHTVNANVEYGLYVRAGDGVWFNNGHIFGASEIVRIQPQDAATQLQGLHFNNVWMDQLTTKNLVITGTSTAGYGDFEFNGCQAIGATSLTVDIQASAENLKRVSFTGGRYGAASGTVFSIAAGDDVLLSGLRIYEGNKGNLGGYGVDVGTLVSDLSIVSAEISGNSVSKLVAGIRFQDTTVVSGLISGVRFENVLTEISAAGTFLDGTVINGCATDRVDFEDTAAASSMTPSMCTEVVEITGASTTVNQVNFGWSGRRIMLRAVDNSQTIKHNVSVANNQRIVTKTGADVVLAAGQAMFLVYNAARSGAGAGWYQQ